MINSEFLTTSAGRLASRVEQQVGATALLADKIRHAYQLTFARKPSAPEISTATAYMQQLQKLFEAEEVESAAASRRSFENFVHMLLCSNEFLYVD